MVMLNACVATCAVGLEPSVTRTMILKVPPADGLPEMVDPLKESPGEANRRWTNYTEVPHSAPPSSPIRRTYLCRSVAM